MNKAPAVATDDSDKAAKTLVNALNSDKFKAIKDEVATYDLTSISQRELVTLGRLLYDADLIDRSVFSGFIYADGDFDASGRQQNQDKLINAYAVFERQLAGSTAIVASGDSSAQNGVDSLTKLNQVTRALAQFTIPDSNNLSISIFA
ncbi:hypothetical protein NVV94_12595 [Pseudomonas sp. LS1212]|uniref:hypothetical protein n=1 Tax=Pseudomonas sp. LS1212 TaxID=2972478 RepID=UPI00215C368A|nr:hypothetical protein [Pseudomonas sp. LS1212]UVJ46294.1 hypothetical protein NVV94_12595 [Pseudomonas sp. LS1212]